LLDIVSQWFVYCLSCQECEKVALYSYSIYDFYFYFFVVYLRVAYFHTHVDISMVQKVLITFSYFNFFSFFYFYFKYFNFIYFCKVYNFNFIARKTITLESEPRWPFANIK
jgi:hypothetical protein